MKSFGLWYQLSEITSNNKYEIETTVNQIEDKKNSESEVEDKEPQYSLHVNFWSLEDIRIKDIANNKNSLKEHLKTPYLDIGIKIKDYSKLDSVTFYCPFVLKLEEMFDLSPKLGTKNNASIIFNSDCEIETKDSYAIVNISEYNEKLLVFPLEQVIKDVFQIKRDERNDGTYLIFKFRNFHEYVKGVEKLGELDTIYIRFRIESSSLKKHIYFDSEPLNKSFESAFSGTRIIDFKVNEKRNIDEKIRAEIIMRKQEWVTFKDIHFLIMVPSSYDLTSFYKKTMTCRELEENLWDDYLGAHIDFASGHVLAYHWKDKAIERKVCEDFACLVKVNYSRAKKETIFLYALSVVALGVLSSMIVTGLNEYWPNNNIYFWIIGLGFVFFSIIIIICCGKKF